MTVKHQYYCNLCGESVLLDADNAIALRWGGAKSHELIPANHWSDAPVHLCHACIYSVTCLYREKPEARQTLGIPAHEVVPY